LRVHLLVRCGAGSWGEAGRFATGGLLDVTCPSQECLYGQRGVRGRCQPWIGRVRSRGEGGAWSS
jgi:hypothetical protein